jgi:hypothetical protein
LPAPGDRFVTLTYPISVIGSAALIRKLDFS